MTRDTFPSLTFGDIVKVVFLHGRSVYGAFHRLYDPETGEPLVTVRHDGKLESYGLSTIQSLEVIA